MNDSQGRVRLDRGVTRALIALTSLGFLALVIAGGAAAWLQVRNQDNSRWVEHTLAVEARINAFASMNERAETGRRGYIFSHQESFRRVFEQAGTALPDMVEELGRLTRDNPAEQQRVAQLRKLIAEKLLLQRQTVAAVRAGRGIPADTFEKDRGVVLTSQIRMLTEQMRLEEQHLQMQRAREQRETLGVFYLVLGLTGAIVVVVAATTIFVMLRYMRALDVSRAELHRLNAGLEDVVEERTADLQRANQEIQRFAYIVSHDLRSPLVNVMGFTAELDAARATTSTFVAGLAESHPDLVDRDVQVAVDEDLPEAIGFIRTSTQKMDRLINAILRLSREGRRTLMPERIDATALAQGIADSLHHRAMEVGAEIAVEPLPRIISDRLALEQILSNLVENAVKYLSPGRPGFIRIAGHRERDRVVYEISDNGRGIDPKDHERIFDLFRRSGTQDRPGEGIGLAHVRTLAYRLGGVIDVKSELDQGAIFRLSLPPSLRDGEIIDD